MSGGVNQVIFEKLKSMIAEEFGVAEDEITLETSFKEDLNADSLDLVELSMAIEEEFDLGEIGDEAMDLIKTVGDAVEFIKARVGE